MNRRIIAFLVIVLVLALSPSGVQSAFGSGPVHAGKHAACNVNKTVCSATVNPVYPSGAGVCNYGQYRNGSNGPSIDKQKRQTSCLPSPTRTPQPTHTPVILPPTPVPTRVTPTATILVPTATATKTVAIPTATHSVPTATRIVPSPTHPPVGAPCPPVKIVYINPNTGTPMSAKAVKQLRRHHRHRNHALVVIHYDLDKIHPGDLSLGLTQGTVHLS